MARRFTGVRGKSSARDCMEIVKTLPFLSEILDREGRNNSACECASGSIVAIVEATGAPEALEAYIHNFRPPSPSSDWLKKLTDRYVGRKLGWIVACTGMDIGPDFAAWQAWYRKVQSSIFWDGGGRRFVVNARAAKARRARIQKALKGR
jgi:hypothetical protein